jgi:DNA-binding transcriptional MerR regulator
MEKSLPSIPAKRYFTIGEVSDLCGVKPYVLRYWEQEFTQLKPMKRRGNRRYYQHHEVLLVRRIRELLYDQGFTISGARNRLIDPAARASSPGEAQPLEGPSSGNGELLQDVAGSHIRLADGPGGMVAVIPERREHAVEKGLLSASQLRLELMSIEALLGG